MPRLGRSALADARAKTGDRATVLFVQLVALLWLCLATQAARAQLPEQVEIRWRDDGSCPRPLRLSLESEIARLLGPSTRTIPPARFDARVERRTDDGTTRYQLGLGVESESFRGERALSLPSCAEAQDAAALLIATAIDPEAVMRASPRVEPAKPPEPPEPPAPVVAPHRWSLLARALFDGFSLPDPTFGLELGGLHARARTRYWAQARYLFAQQAERASSVAAADVDLFAAAVGGAYVWPFGSLVVGPAAELELGVLRARGAARSDGIAGLDGAAPWGAVDCGGVAGYAVHRRVGLELSLFAGLPLWRPRLTVREQAAFYTTAPVTMRVAVGVRVSLGSL